MSDFGILSLVPPILAIGLAIYTRQVIFSLLFGIWIGWIIISGNLVSGSLSAIESITQVFAGAGNTRTVIFTLLIGALIQLIRISGGVNGFIGILQAQLAKVKNPKRTIQVSAAFTGFLLFIESNISILTVGTAFKPLFDKYKLSKEKLAYIADSSSAPSCILFPINAWGAYIMGLLLAYEYLDPFKTLLFSIPFNFYPILTLIMVFYLAYTDKDFGPMKTTKLTSTEKSDNESKIGEIQKASAWFMLLPLIIMVASMPIFLIHSGWSFTENLSIKEKIWIAIGNGSGSSAVMNAIILSLTFTGIWLGFKKILTIKSFFSESLKGMSEMLEMAILMVLAFATGNLCKELGTGLYVANITSAWLSPSMAPALLFITSCFVAFATGTSWGTFAIMVSIAMPLAQIIGINPYLALGAVLGGGVFGDHCSPISDTTLIASLAARCEHIDHVRTQLPYALVTGLMATCLYISVGFMLA